MTQEAVAEAIEMSCAHFGKVERGERPINLSRLAQLSLLLDIPLESLVEGSIIPPEDSYLHQRRYIQEENDFLATMESITKGCSEASLQLMLQLCTAVAHADKTKQ